VVGRFDYKNMTSTNISTEANTADFCLEGCCDSGEFPESDPDRLGGGIVSPVQSTSGRVKANNALAYVPDQDLPVDGILGCSNHFMNKHKPRKTHWRKHHQSKHDTSDYAKGLTCHEEARKKQRLADRKRDQSTGYLKHQKKIHAKKMAKLMDRVFGSEEIQIELVSEGVEPNPGPTRKQSIKKKNKGKAPKPVKDKGPPPEKIPKPDKGKEAAAEGPPIPGAGKPVEVAPEEVIDIEEHDEQPEHAEHGVVVTKNVPCNVDVISDARVPLDGDHVPAEVLELGMISGGALVEVVETHPVVEDMTQEARLPSSRTIPRVQQSMVFVDCTVNYFNFCRWEFLNRAMFRVFRFFSSIQKNIGCVRSIYRPFSTAVSYGAAIVLKIFRKQSMNAVSERYCPTLLSEVTQEYRVGENLDTVKVNARMKLLRHQTLPLSDRAIVSVQRMTEYAALGQTIQTLNGSGVESLVPWQVRPLQRDPLNFWIDAHRWDNALKSMPWDTDLERFRYLEHLVASLTVGLLLFPNQMSLIAAHSIIVGYHLAASLVMLPCRLIAGMSTHLFEVCRKGCVVTYPIWTLISFSKLVHLPMIIVSSTSGRLLSIASKIGSALHLTPSRGKVSCVR